MSNFSFPRSVGRAGLAASAAAFLALGLASPAAADEVETYEGSTVGQYTGNAESGPDVYMTGGSAPASLFNLKLKDQDTVLTAYCIDFRTNIRHNAWYKEDDWANYPGQGDFAQPGKVHWILQNSYPNVEAAALGTEAGVEGLSNEDALSGTQAAIWHFSNDMELNLDDSRNSDAVKAVYTYLTESAVELPQTDEPKAALSITPDEAASGQAGEIVGEFLIETNAAEIPVNLDAPDGVELVDIETGEAVETVSNGDKVGFGVPTDAAEGEASFTLETTSRVETGRLFQGKDSKKPTQTLITAKGGQTKVSASASGSWTEGEPEPSPSPSPTPTPSDKPTEPSDKPTEPSDKPTAPDDKPAPPADDQPTLPVTGGALAGLVAAGVAALGAGGGALYLSRKRKAAAGEETDA
ncbi:thioester domain-containing protein [Nocardiopsis exhalans]|uniref:Thioester domain-containing protein n=1 Tax=Nocardiopsis exhalans TaxID=163604 RepID=A0ABY5DBD8_9ACTN|nr:thioester domain-containing protein [Nocardiopsis exhalans]USY21337.1 thioester domain-containing protein [Nocardiopsis exhalans]